MDDGSSHSDQTNPCLVVANEVGKYKALSEVGTKIQSVANYVDKHLVKIQDALDEIRHNLDQGTFPLDLIASGLDTLKQHLGAVTIPNALKTLYDPVSQCVAHLCSDGYINDTKARGVSM